MFKIQNDKNKILVALSGGVDSSVAALLLKKQKFNIVGAFMKLNDHSGDAEKSAKAVCKKLNIPFYVFDASKEFKKKVIDYFVASYKTGITPNPCVVCNKMIKFGWLLKKAKELNCDYIATGHYTRLRREFPISYFPASPAGRQFPKKFQISNSKFQIKMEKAKDQKKDQTYFLWQLNQEQLRHTLFPLGDFTKKEVKKLAEKYDLPTHNKKESQDICFVPDNDLKKFLQRFSKKGYYSGNIVDIKGNILGKHEGLANYTIGQREKIPAIDIKKYYKKLNPQKLPPFYVIKLDVGKNELVVGQNADLYAQKFIAGNINWLNSKSVRLPLKCQAKIRYGSASVNCIIKKINDKILVTFSQPQRAITPGQSVVFYKKNILIGGGIIL